MSIHFKKIPFDTVKSVISNMISDNALQNWHLLPDDLFQLMKRHNFSPKLQKIDWWEAFEYGYKEIPDEQFISLLFQTIEQKEEKLLIVTDECFKDKMAYEINFSDLTVFIDAVYPEIHQMEFFQPHDLIFVFPESNCLITLHHEGFIWHLEAQD